MVERTKLNHILQLAQHKQKQASDRGDLFKEMVNSSMKSMDKSSPRPEKTKAPEGGPKESKESAERPASDKETKVTDKTEEKSDTKLDKEPSKEPESESDKASDSTLDNLTANPGLTDALGIISHLGGAGILQKGQDVRVDAETKIYSASQDVLPSHSAIPLNQEDLKKQLDKAFLFRPEIKDQSQEIKPLNNFSENLSTKDLEVDLKELTGQNLEVEFKPLSKEIPKDIQVKDLIDSLLGQEETLANTDIKPVTFSEKASEPFEKIFIKVADAAELTPKVALELRDKILISQTDLKNYEIQLNPANLGKIFVKVSMENGITNLEMHFTSKKTMELMKGNMGDLTQIIANNRGTAVTVHMTEQKAPDYLDQNEQQQGNAQEHKQKEEQRQSDEFINRLKETLKQEKAI